MNNVIQIEREYLFRCRFCKTNAVYVHLESEEIPIKIKGLECIECGSWTPNKKERNAKIHKETIRD